MKGWHWPLGALAALLAGLVGYATSRRDRSREQKLTEESQAAQETLAAALKTAQEAKASAEPVHRALLDQLKTAEAQRATTATLMVGLAGALTRVLDERSADRDDSFSYARSLVSAMHGVLQPTAGLLRVVYLARRDEPDGPMYRQREAVGHHNDAAWDIERQSPDATVAELFSGPPWYGALLIDDCRESAYETVGVLVLRAPEADVRSYCRAEVRYGERRFGLLCVDSWSDMLLTDADKQVIVAFGALLAIGLELGER